MTGFADRISDENKLRQHPDPPFTSRLREALCLEASFFEITSGTNVQQNEHEKRTLISSSIFLLILAAICRGLFGPASNGKER